jgi:ABC-2 type transport system ATP-binding protein
MGEIAETADDVVVIDRGRIVGRGTLAEVTGDHRTLEEAFFARTSPATGGAT